MAESLHRTDNYIDHLVPAYRREEIKKFTLDAVKAQHEEPAALKKRLERLSGANQAFRHEIKQKRSQDDPQINLQITMLRPSAISARTLLNRATIEGVQRENKVVFARNGDIMIVLEFGSHGQISCIVSSEILKKASKVFHTMFGPNFKEGTQLAAARSKKQIFRLPLAEDNAEAMLIIFACLHGEIPTLPDLGKTLWASVEMMVQMAVVAEKYMLSLRPGSMLEGLRPCWKNLQACCRLREHSIMLTPEFLFIAWAFRDRESFAEISKELIQNTDGSSVLEYEHLPEYVLEKITEAVQKANEQILEHFKDVLSRYEPETGIAHCFKHDLALRRRGQDPWGYYGDHACDAVTRSQLERALKNPPDVKLRVESFVEELFKELQRNDCVEGPGKECEVHALNEVCRLRDWHRQCSTCFLVKLKRGSAKAWKTLPGLDLGEFASRGA